MSRKPKLDVNRATREELLDVVGLHPAVAASLIEHRDALGRIDDLETLTAVRGIGAGTLERIKATMRVAAEPVAAAPEATASGAEQAAPAGPDLGSATIRAIADTADKVADAGLYVVERTVRGGERMTAAARANGVWARVPSRAEPAGGELGSLWLAALDAQVEDGMATLKGMVGARNVNDVVELQTRFVSQSVGRLADLQRRALAAMGAIANGRPGADR